MWTQFVNMDFDSALRLDALRNSHPVEVCLLSNYSRTSLVGTRIIRTLFQSPSKFF